MVGLSRKYLGNYRDNAKTTFYSYTFLLISILSMSFSTTLLLNFILISYEIKNAHLPILASIFLIFFYIPCISSKVNKGIYVFTFFYNGIVLTFLNFYKIRYVDVELIDYLLSLTYLIFDFLFCIYFLLSRLLGITYGVKIRPKLFNFLLLEALGLATFLYPIYFTGKTDLTIIPNTFAYLIVITILFDREIKILFCKPKKYRYGIYVSKVLRNKIEFKRKISLYLLFLLAIMLSLMYALNIFQNNLKEVLIYVKIMEIIIFPIFCFHFYICIDCYLNEKVYCFLIFHKYLLETTNSHEKTIIKIRRGGFRLSSLLNRFLDIILFWSTINEYIIKREIYLIERDDDEIIEFLKTSRRDYVVLKMPLELPEKEEGNLDKWRINQDDIESPRVII